jgi:DNA-binding MarR family transcriptional regulator
MSKNDLDNSVFMAFAYYDGLVRHSISGEQAGLTKTQLMIMVILQISGVANIGKVAQWLAVSREQASRAVSGLETKGLVEKHRGQENWRNVEVELTQSGIEFADQMRNSTLASINKALSVLDEDEKSRLQFCAQQSVLLLSVAAKRLADADQP